MKFYLQALDFSVKLCVKSKVGRHHPLLSYTIPGLDHEDYLYFKEHHGTGNLIEITKSEALEYLDIIDTKYVLPSFIIKEMHVKTTASDQ